jgi:hypothetical protein
MGEAGLKRTLTVLALGAAVAGCAGPRYPTRTTAAPQASPAAAPPARGAPAPAPAPPPAVAPRSAVPRPDVTVRDQCGAADLQGLVGRPRTEIPVPIDPNRQRVACTTCPVTEDFNPARLNFFFDAQTGVIRQVRCG